MTDMYRIVVHHPSTDTYWYGAFETPSEEQLAGVKDLLERVSEAGDYLTLKNGQGDSYFFPKKMIQECVFTLEKSKQND